MVQLVTVEEGIARIKQIIMQLGTALITTEALNGDLHSRPMTSSQPEFDGNLWFFTNRYSTKVAEIGANSRVNVSFLDQASFVSLAGTARIVDDASKKRQLWQESLRAWFVGGPDDPDTTLIHVTAHSGQYWETSLGPLGSLRDIVKMFVISKLEAPTRETGADEITL